MVTLICILLSSIYKFIISELNHFIFHEAWRSRTQTFFGWVTSGYFINILQVSCYLQVKSPNFKISNLQIDVDLQKFNALKININDKETNY